MHQASVHGHRRRAASQLASLGSASLLALLAGAMPLQAAAAEQAQPNTSGQSAAPQAPTASPEPEPQPQRDIVVTAQKRSESLQKVPISIAVLGGQQLDKQTTGGALEALSHVPSISQSTSDTGGMTQVSVRGVSPAVPFGGGAPTVGYYVDSTPFGQIRAAIVPDANPYDLARVEVLRGPQGTLYGASALNGVIRVLTNDADLSRLEGKARVTGMTTKGGDPSFRGDAAINVPLIQDKLAIRVVAGVDEEGGWIEQPFRIKTNANNSEATNVRVKLAAKPTDALRIDLSAWFSNQRYDAAPYADADGNQSTPLKQPGSTKFQAYNAKITYDLPFMTITSATSHLRFHQKIRTDFSYAAPAFDPKLLQLYSDLPSRVTSEELLFNSNGTGPWRVSAGVFYRDARDDRYQTLPLVLNNSYISWSDRSKSYAAFGQITRSFFDGHFEIAGGLRYFHDKIRTVTLTPSTPPIPSLLPPGSTEVKAHAVTPRVVATWLPSPALTVYASYSQGFRSALPQTPLTLLAAPLPPAKSDKLHNYEVGAKGSLFDRLLTYDLAAYYIKWNDIQQAGSLQYGNPPTYISATINGVSASGFGTDASVTLHPATGFEIGGSASYNDLKEDKNVTQAFPNPDNGVGVVDLILYPKGSRLSFSPKWSASAFANYSFPLVDGLRGQFSFSADYRSKQILRTAGAGAQTTYCASSNAVTNPATVNPIRNGLCTSGAPFYVNGSFQVSSSSGKTFSVFVRNVTNWHGLTDPAYSLTTPFRPRPRTIGAQFEVKF